MSTNPNLPAQPPLAWWHFRIVWFALGLPAVVVVAALFTAGIAVRHADPVVIDPRPAHAVAADDEAAPARRRDALEPAQTARNHAATP